MTSPNFDVAILGGGPAGASMAAYLAKAGVQCVVLERELFPRPHVGESLVPSSTRVFRDLGFLETMEQAKFPHKYGAAWTSSTSRAQATHDWQGLAPDSHVEVRFDEREQAGVDKSYTYHVDRGKFDLLLLQHAHKLGAHVYEGVKVDRVDFEDGRDPVVRFSMGRNELGVSARLVVDASGRRTLLGNQLKLKVNDPVFNQFAVHSWFGDYDRKAFAGSDALLDYIFIHFLPVSNTWVWQIPITDTITSLGVVTQRSNFKSCAPSELFWKAVASRPEVEANLRKATQLRPFTEEGDYSYAMKQITGDRFVLIGDAARFVDPIFSTGVSIALNCSRFASRDIIGALEHGTFTRSAFQKYETTIRRGTKNWYEFIRIYYRLNVLFTYFIADKKYRLDVLKLLQGDVYDEDEPAVLSRMREMVSQIERDPRHIWHRLLNELTADAFKPTG